MNIAVVTSNRADYYLLKRVIDKIFNDHSVRLYLYACGAHPYLEFGSTIDSVIESFPDAFISRDLIFDEKNKININLSLATTISNFDFFVDKNKIDWVIVLGDRYEILGCAIGAFHKKVKIAHLYGGETTYGSNDQIYRDTISLLSDVHFVSNDEHKQRLIEIGIDSDRISIIGYLGLENIITLQFLTDLEIEHKYGIGPERPLILMLFHPEKETIISPADQIDFIEDLVNQYDEVNIVFTSANNDSNGTLLNQAFQRIAKDRKNVYFLMNLGAVDFFSIIKISSLVIGNSSSLLMEVPSLATPSIIVGKRQEGRVSHKDVLTVDYNLKNTNCLIDRVLRIKEDKQDILINFDTYPSELFFVIFKSLIKYIK